MTKRNSLLLAGSIFILIFSWILLVKKNWHLVATEKTKSSKEVVWAWYEATELAPSWDPLVGKIELNGPFFTGTTGVNTAPNGMRFNMIFTNVRKFESYTEVTSLFGAKMTFTHTLTNTNDGCTIHHEVICTGFLSSIYGLYLQNEYETQFPVALKNLARLSDEGIPVTTKKAM